MIKASKPFRLIFLPLIALAFLAPAAQAQTLTSHFVLKVKLTATPTEPSRIRDYAQKILGSEFELSRFPEVYQRSGPNIQIRSEIPILKSLAIVGGPDRIIRSSRLLEQGSKLGLQQSIEQRGSRGDVYTAVVDRRKKKIQYTKNQVLIKEEALDDQPLVDLLALPYYWFGKPVAVKELTVHVTDAKKLRRNEVFVSTELSIDFMGERLRVVRFVRKQHAGGREPLEIWVRKDDGTPIRVISTLNERYGISLDLYPYKKADRS